MEVLFISNTLSTKSYFNLTKERKKQRVEPSQKFFNLILSGLQDKDFNINHMTILPVCRETYDKIIIKKSKEKIKNITYTYMNMINYPIIKQISIYYNVKKEIKKWIKKTENKERVVICDPMLIESTHAVLKLCKKKKINVFAFITDIPSLTFEKNSFKNKIALKVSDKDLKLFDAYILLTEKMNDLCNNNKKKPYIILESVVDSNVDIRTNNNKKINNILYAGKLQKSFGILNLVEAAKNFENLIFDFYGAGELQEEIIQISKKYKNINYKGMISVEEMEKKESEYSLLINPRPITNEFVKYSFPSKTVEYMLSGTPFLTTKLPGIPEEYDKYLNYIDDNSVAGIIESIKKIKEYDYEELLLKAKNAQKFVLENKNKEIQSERIFNFVRNNFYNK